MSSQWEQMCLSLTCLYVFTILFVPLRFDKSRSSLNPAQSTERSFKLANNLQEQSL